MPGPLKRTYARGTQKLMLLWHLSHSSLPAGKKVIGCRWVFANKYDADGNVIKQKARLVAKGFSQVQGKDFDKTYATVA